MTQTTLSYMSIMCAQSTGYQRKREICLYARWVKKVGKTWRMTTDRGSVNASCKEFFDPSLRRVQVYLVMHLCRIAIVLWWMLRHHMLLWVLLHLMMLLRLLMGMAHVHRGNGSL